ncbi:MAG: hypothetical protein IRZ21_10635 [Thermoleophilaceae bacterium]|nr:hypothetical protein [Thermoleophilaceae bacterium]
MDDRTRSRTARRLARRGRVLRLGPLAGAAFLVALQALFKGTWELLPFPDADAALAALAAGAAFGVAVHRAWALCLAALVLPAALVDGAGIFEAIAALVVAGPFALAGLASGVAIARRVQRIALRRMLAAARVRPEAPRAARHARPA